MSVLPAQQAITHTASCDALTTDVVFSDFEFLLTVVTFETNYGALVTVRDPYLFTNLIPVRVQPVWLYAVETRPGNQGMRPCFRPLADLTCDPLRSFPLNKVSQVVSMPELDLTPSMPHYTVWRVAYPTVGAPEMTVVWFRISPW